LTGYIFCNRAV